MKFKVHFPTQEAITAVNKAKQAIRLTPEQWATLGVQLLGLVRVAYIQKSRGNAGDDGIKWAALKPATIKQKNRPARKTGKKKATATGKARPGLGQSAIGINTGLQLSSSTPHFQAPGGGNLFQVDSEGVTIGFGRSYSKYFDAKRPLLPETLPPAWRQQLEATISQWGEYAIGKAFDV